MIFAIIDDTVIIMIGPIIVEACVDIIKWRGHMQWRYHNSAESKPL